MRGTECTLSYARHSISIKVEASPGVTDEQYDQIINLIQAQASVLLVNQLNGLLAAAPAASDVPTRSSIELPQEVTAGETAVVTVEVIVYAEVAPAKLALALERAFGSAQLASGRAADHDSVMSCTTLAPAAA